MTIHKIIACETPESVAAINRIAGLAGLQQYPPEMARELLADTCQQAFLILVPAISREPVAYVVLQVIPPEGEILDLAVLPSLQRRNLGGLLLRKALRVFQEYGVDTCYLEVRESNWRARRFYEQHGFTVQGNRTDYYTFPHEDALIMSRAVGPPGPDRFLT